LATTYQIFERAERIEELAAAGYRLLAEQFPAGRALFRQLEEEEQQHAARIGLLKARYRHDSRLVTRGSSEVVELDLILADSEAVLASIRRGTFARTLEEARVNLVALEERFARAHAEVIAAEGHPALREFFVKLAEQDRGHQALLAGEPALRGAAP
jgi:hypothetical protein